MDFDSAIESAPCFASARQSALRTSLGLDSADLEALLERSEFMSLGGFCGVTQALGSLGLRKSAGPFDWLRSPAEGVVQCLTSGFADFLTYKTTRIEGGHKVFETSWGGSFWHHDIDKQATKDQFARRIERHFGAKQVENPAPRFFVRVANSASELRFASKLLATLQCTFNKSPVYLLVITDMQNNDSLLHVEGTSSHLLFHRVHKDLWLNSIPDPQVQMNRCADKYTACIAAAVRHWAQEDIAPIQDAAAYASLDGWTDSYIEGWMVSYNGGDTACKGYSPLGEPPGYMRVPDSRKPGDIINTKAFGRDIALTVPEDAFVGCVLELRLVGELLSVRLVPDDIAAAAMALMGVTTATVAATTSAGLPANVLLQPGAGGRSVVTV